MKNQRLVAFGHPFAPGLTVTSLLAVFGPAQALDLLGHFVPVDALETLLANGASGVKGR